MNSASGQRVGFIADMECPHTSSGVAWRDVFRLVTVLGWHNYRHLAERRATVRQSIALTVDINLVGRHQLTQTR